MTFTQHLIYNVCICSRKKTIMLTLEGRSKNIFIKLYGKNLKFLIYPEEGGFFNFQASLMSPHMQPNLISFQEQLLVMPLSLEDKNCNYCTLALIDLRLVLIDVNRAFEVLQK